MLLMNEDQIDDGIINNLFSHQPDWMKEHRINSFNKFRELSNPSSRYGLGITLNMGSVELNKDEIITSLGNVSDKKISGVGGVEVKTFDEDPEFVKKYINQLVRYDENKIISLHNGLFNNGIIIKIKKGKTIETPLIMDRELMSKFSFDYIIIVAEPLSKARIIDSSRSKERVFRSKIVELFVGENAKIDYLDIQDFSDETHGFNIKKARLERDSEINWIDCIFGSKFTRSEITSNLDGEGASSRNYGVFFGNNKEQLDISTNAIHNSPRTFSDMFIKGALDNYAKNVFRGLVHIKKNAPYSNGYQKEDTLILGEGAESDPIPKLLIDNNNVKCSHGATVGEIDKEKLFYMMSRGLNEKQAKREFIKGFFQPIIDYVKDGKIREKLSNLIEERVTL